ncbi:MAG: mechanosensitive ion channel [Candidatus Thorarchaeota archaeon]
MPVIQISFFENLIESIVKLFTDFQYLVFLLIELFLLVIVYAVVTRGLSSRLEKVGLSGQASTGISLVIRVIFVVVAAFLVLDTLRPVYAELISLATLFGTALGLAFSQSVGEIVNGLYIIIARPFKVGDYVRIGNHEGIVTDVTLSYTRILQPDKTRLRIPNSKVLKSDVVNFRMNLSDLIKDITTYRLQTEDSAERKTLSTVISKLKAITHTETAYRYTFDLTVHYSCDYGALRDNFDRVCEEWEEQFLVKPKYQVWDTTNTAIIYRVTVIVDEPRELLIYIDDFMDDMLLTYRKNSSERGE